MAIATAAGANRMRQALIVGAAVATLAVAAASPTFAAKGGNGGGGGGGGGSSAYAISLLAPVGAAPTVFTFGSSVGTFSSYGSTNPAYARVVCTANSSTVTPLALGSTVYDVFISIREGTWNTGGYAYFDTTLSAGWTGGGADCS